MQQIVCLRAGACGFCGSPCCQQDITARKGPTSYGNSNSVQVFSAYTFAASRALDWPGGQAAPPPGKGRSEWVYVAKQKGFRSSFILRNPFMHTHFPSVSVVLLVDPVCLQKPRPSHPWVIQTRLLCVPATG